MNDNTIEHRAPEPEAERQVTFEMVQQYSAYAAVTGLRQHVPHVHFEIVDFYGDVLEMQFDIHGAPDPHATCTMVFEGEQWTVAGYHRSNLDEMRRRNEEAGENLPYAFPDDQLELLIFEVLVALEDRLLAEGRTLSPEPGVEHYITEHKAGLHEQYDNVTECPICNPPGLMVDLDAIMGDFDGVGFVSLDIDAPGSDAA